ncbi:MAG: bifunctional 3,4-dihydroxy-2-butanone-4-phosphate synthase/GTP cyclohydrolase II, partial [Phycisphaerales bacterium]
LVVREVTGDWVRCRVAAPAHLLAQLAPQGSVAVDGVSLTVVDVAAESFGVALIPHTLAHTTLGRHAPDALVNLETDLVFKYLARWLSARGPAPAASP